MKKRYLCLFLLFFGINGLKGQDLIVHLTDGTVLPISLSQIDSITFTENNGSSPIADFLGIPTSGVVPLTVSFIDQSLHNPTSWEWSFGDGGISQEQHPEYTFNSPGIYSVQLIVANNNGSDIEIKVDYITVTSGTGSGVPCPGFPNVTDIDGNVYNTVQLGEQCWMKENLKTTRDAIGNDINRDCYDNNEDFCNWYGGLYTWSTIMNGESSSISNPSGVHGICPSGWHVPSLDEWLELIVFVESQGFPNQYNNPNGTGNALKSCRQIDSPFGYGCNTTEHPRWEANDTYNGFDEFGFSGLPGGYRVLSIGFSGAGYGAHWSTATEYDLEQNWKIRMNFNNASVAHVFEDKTVRLSLRCVKD